MFKTSVEKITRSLGRMVEQLEAHAVDRHADADKHIERREHHDDQARIAREQAEHARHVAGKIRGLVG